MGLDGYVYLGYAVVLNTALFTKEDREKFIDVLYEYENYNGMLTMQYYSDELFIIWEKYPKNLRDGPERFPLIITEDIDRKDIHNKCYSEKSRNPIYIKLDSKSEVIERVKNTLIENKLELYNYFLDKPEYCLPGKWLVYFIN